VVPQVLAGEPAAYPADLDAPHSWTYAGDAARTLIAASQDDRAWGQAWHVPSTTEFCARDLTTRLAEAAGAPAAKLERMSAEELDRIGATNPIMAEIPEMLYLFQ
jgi:nucleoside-diphosphate-sugar epimerase